MRKFYRTVAILILIAFTTSWCYALDVKTHKALNEYIAQNALNGFSLDTYLKSNLGIISGITTTLNTELVWQWLRDGGKYEDEPPLAPPYLRSRNHFHNPLLPWNAAGYTGNGSFCSIGHCPVSAILWAQGPQDPDDNWSPGGDWSWMQTRQNYYNALTARVNSDRSNNFANTFRGLGELMHLVQDMSVPEHVRNSGHAFGGYEGWVAANVTPNATTAFLANYTPASPQFFAGNIVGIASFFDTDQYTGANPADTLSNTVGLSEYTNANFFSPDTIFSSNFPNPNKANTNAQLMEVVAEDGISDRGYHIKLNGQNYKLARYSYTYYDPFLASGAYTLDDDVYRDYAAQLLPRAVGYSARLLNYFFRGTLQIWPPETGVYSIADGSKTPYTDINGNQHQQFTKIDTWIENTTLNDEAIGAGTMTAVARYKVIPNYASDLSNYPPNPSVMRNIEYSYSVSQPMPVNPGDIIPGYITRFIFNFENSPIPAGITDLTLQVVFEGTLGNEVDNAVAVGWQDIMEPTHLTFWNLSDMFSLQYPGMDYRLYTFSQLQSMAQSNTNLLNWLDDTGVQLLNDELYLQPATSTFTISFWNGRIMKPAVTVDIPAGGHIRMIVLPNPSIIDNSFELTWADLVTSDTVTLPYTGVVNQAGQDGSYGTPTPVNTFRQGYGPDGQTLVPILQHNYTGIVGCRPGDGGVYCPYPDEQAIPAELTPIPFTPFLN